MKSVDGNDSVGGEPLRLPRPEPAGPTTPPSAAEPRPRTGRVLKGTCPSGYLGEPRKKQPTWVMAPANAVTDRVFDGERRRVFTLPGDPLSLLPFEARLILPAEDAVRSDVVVAL